MASIKTQGRSDSTTGKEILAFSSFVPERGPSSFPPPPSLLCIGRVKWRRKEEGEDECCVFRSRSAVRSEGGEKKSLTVVTPQSEGDADSFPLTFQLLLLLRSLLSFPVGSDSIFPFPVSLSSVSPGRGFAKVDGRPLPYRKPTMCGKNVTHIALFGDSQPVSRGGGKNRGKKSRRFSSRTA